MSQQLTLGKSFGQTMYSQTYLAAAQQAHYISKGFSFGNYTTVAGDIVDGEAVAVGTVYTDIMLCPAPDDNMPACVVDTASGAGGWECADAPFGEAELGGSAAGTGVCGEIYMFDDTGAKIKVDIFSNRTGGGFDVAQTVSTSDTPAINTSTIVGWRWSKTYSFTVPPLPAPCFRWVAVVTSIYSIADTHIITDTGVVQFRHFTTVNGLQPSVGGQAGYDANDVHWANSRYDNGLTNVEAITQPFVVAPGANNIELFSEFNNSAIDGVNVPPDFQLRNSFDYFLILEKI